MTPLDLRLNIAQLNSFLIEKYLMKIQSDENGHEYQKFFADFFFKLNEGLSALGKALGSADELSLQLVIPLQKALTEATLVSYLIEKSADLTDLNNTVKQIYSGNLYTTVANIKSYGDEFNTQKHESDKEVSELIADNSDYFNDDDSLKFIPLHISIEQAAAYIAKHSIIPQVKYAFKRITDLLSYFNSIPSPENKKSTENSFSKLSDTLTIMLVAFAYIEPFFQKDENTSDEFNKLIKDISSIQTSIKGNI